MKALGMVALAETRFHPQWMAFPLFQLGLGCILLLTILHADMANAQSSSSQSDTDNLESIVVTSFETTADGWSVDEVMLQDQRRARFLETCQRKVDTASEKELFETLLRVRKGGRLKVRATQNVRSSLEDYTIAAEIAARRIADEKKVHFDQVLCDPDLLQLFDQIAAELSPKTDPYLLRKAALRLRKSRQLQPELVVQSNNWNVKLQEYTLTELTTQLSELTTRPGIYIFRDATGYLYIGQSNNLRERLTHHLKESDRDQLRKYLLEKAGAELKIELHEFLEGSPGEKLTARRAYESELIRSREPRLNLAP